MHKNPVARALGAITVGEAVIVENLLMFPLFRSGSDPDRSSRRTLDYTVLDDALTGGVIEITEVSAQGSVPELLVVNRGPIPVLIVDGEELIGAKQMCWMRGRSGNLRPSASTANGRTCQMAAATPAPDCTACSQISRPSSPRRAGVRSCSPAT